MKNKMYKWTTKDKNMVKFLVREAIDLFNMHSWVINCRFLDGEITPDYSKDGEKFISTATSYTTYEYEKMDIKFRPALLALIKDNNMAEVKECVYHELLHGLTDELFNLAMRRFVTESQCIDAVERLTQRLAMICTKK